MIQQLRDIEKHLYVVDQYFASVDTDAFYELLVEDIKYERSTSEKHHRILHMMKKWLEQPALVQRFQQRPELLHTIHKVLVPKYASDTPEGIQIQHKEVCQFYQQWLISTIETQGLLPISILETTILPNLPIPQSPSEFWKTWWNHTPSKTMSILLSTNMDRQPSERVFTSTYFRVLEATEYIQKIVHPQKKIYLSLPANAFFGPVDQSGNSMASIEECLEWCNKYPIDAQLYAESVRRTPDAKMPFFILLWEMQYPKKVAFAQALEVLNIPSVDKVLNGTFFRDHPDRKHDSNIMHEYEQHLESIMSAIESLDQTIAITALDSTSLFEDPTP